MKIVKQLLLSGGIILIILSFTKSEEFNFIGTYGVSDNDPSQIELILNNDCSFYFQDLSLKESPIQVKGEWKLKNDHILLVNYNSEANFHTKWKITEEGKVAKSRKGLTFYRLIKK